jgi:hypothetical protein
MRCAIRAGPRSGCRRFQYATAGEALADRECLGERRLAQTMATRMSPAEARKSPTPTVRRRPVINIRTNVSGSAEEGALERAGSPWNVLSRRLWRILAVAGQYFGTGRQSRGSCAVDAPQRRTPAQCRGICRFIAYGDSRFPDIALIFMGASPRAWR